MYESFEDLDVWKSAVELSIRIYKAFMRCRDFGFKDQITRSAVSISSNIAEGMERDSIKETIHYLHIAKGSCAECRTQLLIAENIGYLDDGTYIRLKTQAEAISRMLHGLIKSFAPGFVKQPASPKT